MRRWLLGAALAACAAPVGAQTTLIAPGVLQYGSANCVGFDCYGSADPKAGATLTGLATGASTVGSSVFAHGFPFDPGSGAFAGTDQIYVGSAQSGFNDGYSGYAGRLAGPQVLTLDYGSLLSSGSSVTGLTLGIMTDDFQFPAFGNPYTARLNGTVSTALSALLNSLDETGPRTQFVTFGVDPALLAASNVLTLTIDQGGSGGDGWAVDFLTVGVTTGGQTVTPEPSTLALAAAGAAALGATVRRRRRPGRGVA